MTFLTALVLLVAFPVALAYLTTRTGRRTHVPPDDKPTPQDTGKAKGNDATITIGGRMIYTSFIIAIASLFLDWADASFLFWHLTSLSGIALSMTVLLVIWSYPLYVTIRRAPLRFLPWLALTTFSLISPVIIWNKIDHTRKFLVIDVDAAFGVGVYAIASLTLLLGMFFHQVELAVRYLRRRGR
jgi:hypothetical protein